MCLISNESSVSFREFFWLGLRVISNVQPGDLRLSVPPLGQGIGARTHDRGFPLDLRSDTVTIDGFLCKIKIRSRRYFQYRLKIKIRFHY
ncbi:hypothetical protein PoB_005960500 [Plakobranchus ocellatus]|uniref:Uncharacterized protein n=1 Tax=Plakobranchus ocellatus TaxID=259542 RepID=A0AAV4CJN2_9GAST|nr:hypothetical protein PoB_005960500 [Plakobranchus ocellatus]